MILSDSSKKLADLYREQVSVKDEEFKKCRVLQNRIHLVNLLHLAAHISMECDKQVMLDDEWIKAHPEHTPKPNQ